MSKTLIFGFGLSLVLLFPKISAAQVLNTAQSIQGGSFTMSASPAVYMKDGANELALFVYGGYGLAGGLDLHVRAGFFETSNYVGGALEWTLKRREAPYISILAGAHRRDDPGFDGTMNLTFQTKRGFEWYLGLDTELILDDDPDLPAWIFVGLNHNLIDQVDLMAEFNYGIFEIAPHILAAGFIFYF